MKVIKHGNTVKELTCPECGCIFTAVGVDTCYRKEKEEARDEWGDLTGTYVFVYNYHEPFIPCPECGHECREEDQNDEG